MSHYDAGVDRPDEDAQPVAPVDDEDVPARRLLAHDLEHLIWDHDGEASAPPPD
jgi:hypothetical protein